MWLCSLSDGTCFLPVQPILEWYKELPDKLGKIIDANKGNTKRAPGHDVQTRPQLGKESAVEKEYLKSEGMDDEQIDNYVGPEVRARCVGRCRLFKCLAVGQELQQKHDQGAGSGQCGKLDVF